MRQRSLLLLFAVFIVSASFSYFAASDCLRSRAVCFGTNNPTPDSQLAPFRYRVLEPFLVKLFTPAPTQESVVVTVIVLYSVITALSLPMLFIWLRRFVNEDRALVGVMVYALVNCAAFHMWFISLGTPLEVLFVLLTLLLIDGGWLWIAPVVALASLNRESSLLLVGIYAAWNWSTPSKRAGIVGLCGIWGLITLGLHVILGAAPHTLGLVGTALYNWENIIDGLATNAVLLPLYILIVQGYRHAPPKLKRLALVGGVYVGALVVGSTYGEIMRLILPILPLFIPLALNSKVSDTLQPNSKFLQ